jgi:anti-anti-sigma regulatory factor
MEARISVERAGDLTVLHLAGRLTATGVGGCHAALCSAIGEAQRLAIRFDDVVEADLTLLQLLCSAHRSASAVGLEITLLGPIPAAVVAVAVRAGMEHCVGGPPACLLRDFSHGREV